MRLDFVGAPRCEGLRLGVLRACEYLSGLWVENVQADARELLDEPFLSQTTRRRRVPARNDTEGVRYAGWAQSRVHLCAICAICGCLRRIGRPAGAGPAEKPSRFY